MCRLSRAADHAALWITVAAILSVAPVPLGRRAAVAGLSAVAATSIVVNAAIKPMTRRSRPDRRSHRVPPARHVPMPVSGSLPSGHAASAFAFATGVAAVLPGTGAALHAPAAAVAYSRVHVGVHFPGDVVAGALVGTTVARAVAPRLAVAR